jgi:15-cis-phytoene synthase
MRTSGRDGSVVTDAVREAARRGEPDRYLAALLAPRSVRGDLAALAAVSAELSRVVQIVSEPMMGAIRLQWWRDAVETVARGERAAHPLADALGDAIRRHRLPVALVQSLIDASSIELGTEPAAGEQALAGYLEAAEATQFRLALLVLGRPHASEQDAVVGAAARAYGIARRPGRLLLAVQAHETSPACPHGGRADGTSAALPPPGQASDAAARDSLAMLRRDARSALATARAKLHTLEPGALPALLPLVMVEPYLRAQERVADPLRDIADVAPLTRVWRIWWASKRGRI